MILSTILFHVNIIRYNLTWNKIVRLTDILNPLQSLIKFLEIILPYT